MHVLVLDHCNGLVVTNCNDKSQDRHLRKTCKHRNTRVDLDDANLQDFFPLKRKYWRYVVSVNNNNQRISDLNNIRGRTTIHAYVHFLWKIRLRATCLLLCPSNKLNISNLFNLNAPSFSNIFGQDDTSFSILMLNAKYSRLLINRY